MSEYYLNLLVEGRLEDVKSKWALPVDKIGINDGETLGLSHGNLNGQDIDHLSQNDPSGNNKYLTWMVGMMNLPLSEWETRHLDRSEVYMTDIIDSVTRYHESLED